ncbi:MAG: YlxR family protein [Bacillota bacterium]|nr:YlxR family protein [Bacillota bacterium]
MKTRKVPMRRCIGCMESRPKKELIRIVSDKEGNVILDGTGKAQGRGAYLCPSKECFEAARKKKAISRNLEITVTEQQLEDLYREFEQYEK